MTPFERSRAELPKDIRKALEESNLPIEVATAIADLCEQRAEEVTTDKGMSLLRQMVNLVDHFHTAVWYDKDKNRHPAVTPLMLTLAAEVREYVNKQP